MRWGGTAGGIPQGRALSTTSIQTVANEQLHELVARVEAAAGQDMPFLSLLIELQAKLIGGLSGAVFVLRKEAEPRLVTVYPLAPDRHVRVEPDRVAILRDCVERCRLAGRLSVYRVAMGGHVYHAVCTPLQLEARLDGITVVMVQCEDKSELGPHLAHLQWAARLYKGHVATRGLRRQLRTNAETRKALVVLTAAQQASGFRQAAMATCNQLRAELDAARVSLGWARGQEVRLEAMSDTANVDRRQDLSERIQAAMEECFDQAQPVVAPPRQWTPAEPGLDQAVCRSHQSLIGSDGGQAVCSVPLRYQDAVCGVLTVERSERLKFGAPAVSHLQAVADLVAPRLCDRYADERPALVRLWRSAAAAAGRLIGPEHVGAKVVALAACCAVVLACVVRVDYRIKAPFEFEPARKRVYAAPFAGFIAEVMVREGAVVSAGDPLIRLDDRHLRPLREVAERQRQVAEIESQRSWETPGQTQRFRAEMRRFEAERDMYDMHIADALLTAVTDGQVVEGDWHEHIGVRVELGQTLLQVAPLDTGPPDARRPTVRAAIRVDEADIERVRAGSTGQVATHGAPGETVGFEVTRVVPIGEAEEGHNVFVVYGQLEHQAAHLRPGVAGVARIDAGRYRLVWVLTHRAVDFMSLKLWW